MKISKFILGLSLFFLTGIVPVFAQGLTILPAVGENVDCGDLLQKYELTGKIPTMAETDKNVQEAQGNSKAADQSYKAAEQDYNKASQNYDQISQKMDSVAIADCNSNNPINSSGCNEYKKNQQAVEEAKQKLAEAKKNAEQAQQNSSQLADQTNKTDKSKTPDRDNLLACGIKTGRISLQMVPFFVTRIADFILSLIGLLCVLFIVIGGYQYIVGGLTDQKEKGKNTIKHALMGMSIAILSWVIVTAVMNAITG